VNIFGKVVGDMNITIFAAGSRGDIQPCVVLARGLQKAGYRATLAAPEDFTDFVQGHGVDFYPLRGDVQKIMASDTGREFMEKGGGNPLKSVFAVRKMIAPVVLDMASDVYEACREADGLICLGVFSAFGVSVAESLGIPMLNIEPTPLLPTRAFPAASWPIQKSMGGLHNYLSGVLMLDVVWLWYRPFVNEFRKRLGLSMYNASRFLHTLKTIPMLGAYSPGLIPHPRDWPESLHIIGSLYLDSQADWQPSPELEAFLEAGKPPVYFGFGSMAGETPEQLAGLVLEALARTGQRGLLLTGWGGLCLESIPENVFMLETAPHSWLFPRMAAVVHHGGAGTTAEGLRAGVPSIIVPFILDQPFWGARIHAAGLGPKPIPHKNLNADNLAEAIKTAVSDTRMIQTAREFGEIVRTEDSITNAVNVVRRYFGEPST